MLLHDGLTEGRLTTLLRRWSKRKAQQAAGERSMDDEDGGDELPGLFDD